MDCAFMIFSGCRDNMLPPQFPVSRYLGRLKADMFERNSRYFIYLFVR